MASLQQKCVNSCDTSKKSSSYLYILEGTWPYCFELSTEVTDSNKEETDLDRLIKRCWDHFVGLCVQEMDCYSNNRTQSCFELLVESSVIRRA